MAKKIKKNKGFTLVEIMIAVLIIGILAAISVTQYKKSVLKSRFSSLIPIAKSVYDGQEVFYLSHGKYANNFASLDVLAKADISGTQADINGVLLTMENNTRHTYVKATKNNLENNYIMYQSKSKYFPGEIHCEAKTDNSIANWLCKSALGGEKLDRSLTEGYTDYVIRGDGNGFFPKDWFDVGGKDKDTKLTISNGDTCTARTNISPTTDLKCNYVDFSNGSICYSEIGYSCNSGVFTDSMCIANYYDHSGQNCGGNIYINSVCEGNNMHSCQGSSYDNSKCIANGVDICGNTTFINNSKCVSNGSYSCQKSDFTNSSCEGNDDTSCITSTYTDSSCIANKKNSCTGSTFKGNSICYANASDSCGTRNDVESTYEGNACCKGDFCPGYAPKCDCGIDPNTGQHALSC